MRYLKHFDVIQIAKILKLEPAASGKYDCPHIHQHEAVCHNSALSITDDGSFSCQCGIKGRGWIELVSKLYKIPRWRAENWLKTQLYEIRNGKSTN